MDLREIGWGGGRGLDSSGSRYGPLAGCGECGHELWRSGATELVSYIKLNMQIKIIVNIALFSGIQYSLVLNSSITINLYVKPRKRNQ
jgi:hypothetical protein